MSWPRGGWAQQAGMPVVGWLRSAPFVGAEQHVAAFRQGLSDKAFIEGQNVRVEYRSAEGYQSRLASLTTELVQRQVNVIFCDNIAALAAKAATASIPIVFAGGGDAVKEGLVASLNRPGGNVTGVNFFTGAIGGTARRDWSCYINRPSAMKNRRSSPTKHATDGRGAKRAEAAAESTGQQLLVMQVNDVQEIESAITTLVEHGAGALLVGSGPFFYSTRKIVIELASRHALASSYTARQAAEDGGLISYGTDLTDALRQGGNYVGEFVRARNRPTCR